MSRRGVALVAALMVLSLIALLLGAALAAFRLAARSAEFAKTDAVLTAAADYALNSVVASARQLRLDTLPLGIPDTVATSVAAAGGVAPVVVATRLANGVVWLVADVAEAGIVEGHRRVNVVAWWRPPGPMPPSPIAARGSVRLAAGVTFATDSLGAADCRTMSVTDVTTAPGATVVASPGVTSTMTAGAGDSTAYFLSTSQRALLAGSSGVVHVAGDTTIAGGAFTGILIVDGALTITGSFEITGVVASGGPIVALAGGLVVNGALMSFAAPNGGQPAIDLGPAAIRYSRCAVAAVFRGAIPLRPVAERSWAELF
ncbi:MAG: hypothetical protein ACREPM_00850 [Gemmatimonadaceae bacterium]